MNFFSLWNFQFFCIYVTSSLIQFYETNCVKLNGKKNTKIGGQREIKSGGKRFRIFLFFLLRSVFRGNKIGLNFHECGLNCDWRGEHEIFHRLREIVESFKALKAPFVILPSFSVFLSIFQSLFAATFNWREKSVEREVLEEFFPQLPIHKARMERKWEETTFTRAFTHAWIFNWDWKDSTEC